MNNLNNNNPPLTPDELFRYYRRGMLDQDSLHTQIILNLIELMETQQALKALFEMSVEEMDGLSLDVAVLARHLQLPRPSQSKAQQNGTIDSDQTDEDEGKDDNIEADN